MGEDSVDVGGTKMISAEVVRRFETQDGVTRTVTRELFTLGGGKTKEGIEGKKGDVENDDAMKGKEVWQKANLLDLEEMKTAEVDEEASGMEQENLIDFD